MAPSPLLAPASFTSYRPAEVAGTLVTSYHPAIVEREVRLMAEAFAPVADLFTPDLKGLDDIQGKAFPLQSNILEVVQRVDWILCNGGECVTPTARQGFNELKAMMLGLVKEPLRLSQ